MLTPPRGLFGPNTVSPGGSRPHRQMPSKHATARKHDGIRRAAPWGTPTRVERVGSCRTPPGGCSDTAREPSRPPHAPTCRPEPAHDSLKARPGALAVTLHEAVPGTALWLPVPANSGTVLGSGGRNGRESLGFGGSRNRFRKTLDAPGSRFPPLGWEPGGTRFRESRSAHTERSAEPSAS